MSANLVLFFSSMKRYSSLGALFLHSTAVTFIILCLKIDLPINRFKSSH